MRQYEVVKAKTPQEARNKSTFRKNDLYYINDIKYHANSDGTYTVIPNFLKCENK